MNNARWSRTSPAVIATLLAALMLGNNAQGQTRFTKITNGFEAANNLTGTYGRIPLGTGAGKGDTNHVIGACILRDGDTYKMWYGGHAAVNYRLFYATSSDGLTWTKSNNVVESASNTTGTEGRIPLGTGTNIGDMTFAFRASVIKDDGAYKMWYSGYNGTNYRIFYATSPDGRTWTKSNNVIESASNTTGTDGRIPLGTGAGKGDTNHVLLPRVIKDGDGYKMWYTGYGAGSKYAIFHARSEDGVTWTKWNNSTNELSNTTGTEGRVPPGLSGSGDMTNVLLMGVIKDDNVYRLWYVGNGPSNWKGIYYATSPDGLTWTKKNNTEPVASDTGPFTDGQIGLGVTSGRGDTNILYDGDVIRDGAVYRLWYSARGPSPGNFRLFAATAPADHPTVSNVTASMSGYATADLVGHLVATGAAPATVRVFYGTNDAGFAWAQWQTNALLGDLVPGVYTQQVALFSPLTTYYYRFHATNDFGEDWADTEGSFTTPVWPNVENRPVGDINIPAGTAALNGFLVSSGGAPVTVSVYWGDTDGGTPSSGLWAATNTLAGTAWTDGDSLTWPVSGLVPNQRYYYRFYATNSIHHGWAAETESFLFSGVTVTNTDGSAMAPPDAVATDTGILTIQRDPSATNDALTVSYSWSGTAIEGEDYILSPAGTSVTLPAGVAETNITVTALWNPRLWAQPSRTLWLTLEAGGYGIGTPASNIVTVQRYVYTPGANASVTTGNWTNGAIWRLGRRPLPGDSVTISNSVTLSETTDYLESFTITNATLTFTNWTTQLRVLSDVTLLKSGRLTCAGPFMDGEMTNRVWVSCSNLNLATGSLGIDVAAKGYAAGYGQTYDGQGPGGGLINRGGSYGGAGGNSGGAPYGSTNAPMDPGSGGGGAYNGAVSGRGGAGGGAVWIQASGAVTVNGPINANGGTKASTFGAGGSGGSILVECNTFTGSNLLSAVGGGGASFGGVGGNGGGGRIAVLYNTDAQSLLPVPSAIFTTSTGTGGDLYYGGAGTLYFPDSRFLTETIPHTGMLVIPGFTNWAPNSLVISNALIRFYPNGFQVAVASNLTITGVGTGANNYQGLLLYGGSLSCGGDSSVKGSTLTLGRNNADGAQFSCGGNLTLTNGAIFRVYSAETNVLTENYGALVTVAGNLTIASNAWVYPYSNTTNGGSPFFRVRNLTIDAGGGFNAFGLGYAGGYYNVSFPGAGPGGGQYADGGGGHGGVGGLAKGGGIYGSSNAPVQPGSGGGGNNAGSVARFGGAGGGVVRVLATGAVTVNGAITASGANKAGTYGGGGAGGSIYLYCQRFSGTGGTLTANGGTGLAYDGTNPGGGGGGGRISVQRITDTSAGGVLAYVEGGQNGIGSKNGGDGTIVWGLLPFPGSVFSIR
jgi:hypothetical protein